MDKLLVGVLVIGILSAIFSFAVMVINLRNIATHLMIAAGVFITAGIIVALTKK